MSAAPNPRVSVTELREAVRRAVAETSTYQVAEAVRLSEPWVRKFVSGAEPQRSTVEKLLVWYAADRRERAHAALETFLEAFPEGERQNARTYLLRLLREAHARAGTDPPPWLIED